MRNVLARPFSYIAAFCFFLRPSGPPCLSVWLLSIAIRPESCVAPRSRDRAFTVDFDSEVDNAANFLAGYSIDIKEDQGISLRPER